MLSSEECRKARAALELTREELSGLSGVGERTIIDFEREAREPINSTRFALKTALESAGAVFGDNMVCVPMQKKDSTHDEITD